MSRPNTLRRRPEVPEDEGWLITFADMCVLLMCFFVLLFSLSAPDMSQFKMVAEALREKGFYNDTIPTEDPYEKIKKQLSMSLGASGFDQYIFAKETPDGIDLELSSGAFFEPGSARFKPEAIPMLDLVAAQVMLVARENVMIDIEGHTDDSPVASEQFPSNWELSGARAANVVRFILNKNKDLAPEKRFPPQKLRAIGRAATEPKAPNRDAEGTPILANQELNRRVVIRMIKGKAE